MNNSTRAREDSLFTVCSTVCEIFAVKPCNSAQRGANPISQDTGVSNAPQAGENERKNINEPPSLLRNDVSGTNHWLKVLLEGVESNRSAIGAMVVATYGDRRQAQAVLAQSSYLSVNDRRLHFGLGAETKASVEIQWPNGGRETVEDIAADQLVVIREGAGIVRRESFSRRKP